MAETKVILCDNCKNIVAMTTCEVCGKDLCKNCTCSVKFSKPMVWRNPSSIEESIFNVVICPSCERVGQKISNEIWQELKELFLKKFKALIMLETIEREKKK